MTQCYNPESYYNFYYTEPYMGFLTAGVSASIAATVYAGLSFIPKVTGVVAVLHISTEVAAVIAVLHFSNIEPVIKLAQTYDDVYHYNIDTIKCHLGLSNQYSSENYFNLAAIQKNHDNALSTGVQLTSSLTLFSALAVNDIYNAYSSCQKPAVGNALTYLVFAPIFTTVIAAQITSAVGYDPQETFQPIYDSARYAIDTYVLRLEEQPVATCY